MYTRNNRQSSTSLPPDYSGTALSSPTGSPRYVSRQSNTIAKKAPREDSNKPRAVSDQSSEAASAAMNISPSKRSALTSAGSVSNSTYIRRPYEKNDPNSRLYAERDLYPPFGNHTQRSANTEMAETNGEDEKDKEENEASAGAVFGSKDIETDTEEDKNNDAEENSYIPPLTSAQNGFGIFTKRELNTDDLLLAGIIFIMMQNGGESEESNLETALLMALIFISGL